jgi:hypothetical protein
LNKENVFDEKDNANGPYILVCHELKLVARVNCPAPQPHLLSLALETGPSAAMEMWFFTRFHNLSTTTISTIKDFYHHWAGRRYLYLWPLKAIFIFDNAFF